jgi:RNA polymerase sigma-70 factor (ECF subfamily)
MKSEAEATRALDLYADTIRRICFIHLKNHADVEDVFQEVFLKYILYERLYESDAHEKAWLIRVTINQCKDVLKSFFRRKVYSLNEIEMEPTYEFDDTCNEVLNAVLSLPDKYRDVIYLHYYEGYTAVEIAKLLDRRENTVYTWLTRGKSKLKELLGGDSFGR